MTGDEEEIMEFPQLQKLKLGMLGRLISFYSGSTPTPIISSSQERHELDPMSSNQRLPNSLFNKKVAFPNLEEVEIHTIDKVKMIWEYQLHLNLRKMTVSWCPSLTSIFPTSVALALKQLETLSIGDCKNLKEIVSKEEEDDSGPTFVFPKLTFLNLSQLPELERFVGGGANISDWASNKLIEAPSNLNVQKVDALFSKVVLLKELRLEFLKVDQIWDDQFAIVTERINCWFQNLTILEVSRCDNLSYLFTSSMVRSLTQLKELEVNECESIEEIVTTKGEMAEEIQGVTSVSELLFPNLTTIDVSRCNVLKYLFSSRLALRGLSCLKEISVRDCESMKSIVSRESENRITGDDQLDDEEEEIMEFTQLRQLELRDLGCLISFYSSSTPSPIISSSQERQEQDPMSSNQRLSNSLFNKKVVLPKLKELTLFGINVDRIWDDQLAIGAQRINRWFQNLTNLRVWNCNNLSYLFTSSMVRSLAQLKELAVWNCQSIEEIVATKGEMAGDEEEIIEFTQLRELTLKNLGRLISFYSSSTPNPIISSSQQQDLMSSNQRLPISLFNKKVAFPNLVEVDIGGIHKVKMIWENQLLLNLRYLTVDDCPNLTSIFPTSVALALKQLKVLRISHCENLKEIVSKEEEEDGGPTFVFPKLTGLCFWKLPELERFYGGGGADISDWPSLSDLQVYCCDKLIDLSISTSKK